MKKICCHNIFIKILSSFLVLFGLWGIYINLKDSEKNYYFITFSLIFTIGFLYLFFIFCKKITFNNNTIIHRNNFFKKNVIQISDINKIQFLSINTEKYIIIIHCNNKKYEIEYSNKKIEEEFKIIYQQILNHSVEEE